MKPKKAVQKKVWAVVDRTIDIYWPNNDIGFFAIFSRYSMAKRYSEENTSLDGKKEKVVSCTISYSLPTKQSKGLKDNKGKK